MKILAFFLIFLLFFSYLVTAADIKVALTSDKPEYALNELMTITISLEEQDVRYGDTGFPITGADFFVKVNDPEAANLLTATGLPGTIYDSHLQSAAISNSEWNFVEEPSEKKVTAQKNVLGILKVPATKAKDSLNHLIFSVNTQKSKLYKMVYSPVTEEFERVAYTLDTTPLTLTITGGAPPATETDCEDNLDNDNDALTDCNDPDCCSVLGALCDGVFSTAGFRCLNENLIETACTDQQDNDNDALTDCDDPNCCSSTINECKTKVHADFSCSAEGTIKETNCADLKDNDVDSWSDCSDIFDCCYAGSACENKDARYGSRCLTGGIAEETICNDNDDNDADTLKDCADPDCAANSLDCPPSSGCRMDEDCPSGQVCQNELCTSCPETCQSHNYECGGPYMFCRALVNCGSCPQGETCVDGTCQTPISCAVGNPCTVNNCPGTYNSQCVCVDTPNDKCPCQQDADCPASQTCTAGQCVEEVPPLAEGLKCTKGTATDIAKCQQLLITVKDVVEKENRYSSGFDGFLNKISAVAKALKCFFTGASC